jgi:hypothetical protein
MIRPDASATNPRQVRSTTTGPINEEYTRPLARSLDFIGLPLVIEPSAGQLSGDAGLLPGHQFDQRIRLTRAFAGDSRDHNNRLGDPRTARPVE